MSERSSDQEHEHWLAVARASSEADQHQHEATRAQWCVIVMAAAALAFVAALLLTGCGQAVTQVEVVAANAMAAAVNAKLPELAQTEQDQGDQVIAGAKSVEQATAGLGRVRDRWRPVWTAVDLLKAVHDRWASALEAGADTAGQLQAVLLAYCDVRRLLEPDHALPEWAALPCPRSP